MKLVFWLHTGWHIISWEGPWDLSSIAWNGELNWAQNTLQCKDTFEKCVSLKCISETCVSSKCIFQKFDGAVSAKIKIGLRSETAPGVNPVAAILTLFLSQSDDKYHASGNQWGKWKCMCLCKPCKSPDNVLKVLDKINDEVGQCVHVC